MGQEIYLSIVKREYLKGKKYTELTEDEQVNIHNKSDTLFWLSGRWEVYNALDPLFYDTKSFGNSYFVKEDDILVKEVLNNLYQQRNELLNEHDKCVEAIKYNQMLMLASKSKEIVKEAQEKLESFTNSIKGNDDNDDCGDFWDNFWVLNRTIEFMEFARELIDTEEFIKDYAIFISISY